MLDHVAVFTHAGLVLWQHSFAPLEGDPVDEFVRSVLLEERHGGEGTADASTMSTTVGRGGHYCVQWALVNELDLVFVVVYQKILTLVYVEELLQYMAKDFVLTQRKRLARRLGHEGPGEHKKVTNAQLREVLSTTEGCVQYYDRFQKLFQKASAESKRIQEERRRERQLQQQQQRHEGEGAVETAAATGTAGGADGSSSKKPTVWHGSAASGKLNRKQRDALDRSLAAGESGKDAEERALEERVEQMRREYLPSDDEDDEDENDDDIDGDGGENNGGGGVSSWFGSSYLGNMLKTLTGNKDLEESDLEPVMARMREQLSAKNVATDIADDICASVQASLIGQRLASFTSVETVVREALEEAVLRILTPKRSTDVLREVLDAKARGRPYVIVFIGVNGVGKSTSLAKVGYYLKQHNVRPLIAACDTFRSGAVEQLLVHARCLDVPLFNRGYAKDPSSVARAAIEQATADGCDCVLIDTAGRMQNNEPLMRSLATLIADNRPDLVLFVGEALVGNDGIDQLSMFDRALQQQAPPGEERQVDGIVLTKFDTIDDKVGAALSMCYMSGQPIVFVGTGQKYNNLRTLSPTQVVAALMRS